MVSQCNDLCKRFTNAIFILPYNISYIKDKYCATCEYKITKEDKNLICPCCRLRYRLGKQNKHRKYQVR
jgi:hypothetical protein